MRCKVQHAIFQVVTARDVKAQAYTDSEEHFEGETPKSTPKLAGGGEGGGTKARMSPTNLRCAQQMMFLPPKKSTKQPERSKRDGGAQRAMRREKAT